MKFLQDICLSQAHGFYSNSTTNNVNNKKCNVSSVIPWARNKISKVFTKKTLYKRLPILSWLPKYNSDYAIGDLIAGITVGLTVIPQSLAYASISGLPPEYGLYGSFLGPFIYIFLGSCKEVPLGPAAITSLMTYQTIGNKGFGIDHAILLTFLVGIIELLMGVFGLGFIIDFVSGPVSSGFTSAVALVILTSQMKDILCITVKGSTFLQQWISIFKEIHNTSAWDAGLGICCIIVLLLIRIVGMLKIGPIADEEKTTAHKVVNKTLWIVGALRNTLVIIVCGLIGYWFSSGDGEPPMKLIGFVPPGFPEVKLPPFSYTKGNVTYNFLDMCSDLGSGLFVVPLIGLLENIAICKAFADGKTIDASQELIAIGVGNIGSSFVQAYPTTGSVPRAAVNHASGVKTPLGGLYTGILVILSLLFFTPYFAYIPKSSLAAVIIAAVIFMVEFHVIKPMWRIKKTDLLPATGTFIFCLVLPLELGILLGIGLNMVFILYHAARPKISVESLMTPTGIQYLMLTPDRCLIFPSVDYVRRLVTKNSLVHTFPVVIDCTYIYGADYTAAKVIESLSVDFQTRGQPLLFYNVRPSVNHVFEGLSPTKLVIFYKIEDIDVLLKETTMEDGKQISVL